MMWKKQIIFSILCLTLFSRDLAGAEKAPLFKNAYWGLEPGARAFAIGGAFVAVGGNASCFYWNPAGLGLLPQSEAMLGFNYTKDIEVEDMEVADLLRTATGLSGKRLSFVAFSENQGALSWRPLSSVCENSIYKQNITAEGDTIERWTDIEYSINEFGLSMTTSMGATDQETQGMPCILGMNIKYLNGRIGVAERSRKNGIWEEPNVNLDSGNGYSIDLGFLYLKRRIALGFAVQNVLAKLYWHDYSGDRINANLRGGIAFRLFNGFILASDVEKRWDDDAPYIYHIGAEKILKHWGLSIRLGAYGTNLLDEEKTIYTSGIGYSYSNYRVDTTVSGKYEGKDSKLSFRLTISIPFEQ
jgi:hypothetical protein